MFSTFSTYNSILSVNIPPNIFITTPTGTQYTYLGSDQTVIVPTGKKYMTVFAWGAGGANPGLGSYNTTTAWSGGGGGYTSATFNVSSGQSYTVIVGQGGTFTSDGHGPSGTYGGGGGSIGDSDAGWRYCAGGGRSAVKYGGNDIITAGGGGGGGIGWGSFQFTNVTGGAGGGLIGGNGNGTGVISANNQYGGFGGNTISGQGGSSAKPTNNGSTNGNLYVGGNGGLYGMGGGGGYYGGGGGGDRVASWLMRAGGGGSSYVNLSLCASRSNQVILQANTYIVANDTQLPTPGTIGWGGNKGVTITVAPTTGVAGQNGLVMIYFQ